MVQPPTDPRYGFLEYIVSKRLLVLLGAAVDVTTPDGMPVLFCQQKAFRLREDIRLYSDQSKAEELLSIQARQILDFSGAYDVTDSRSGEWVGTVRRRGWRSMLRDLWELTDPDGNVLASFEEDNLTLALVRRFLTDLVPQSYDIRNPAGELAGEVRQFFNPFHYRSRLLLYVTSAPLVDRRLLLAATLLLATVEGRQSS